MADFTIGATDLGAYEKSIAAGATLVVAAVMTSSFENSDALTVLVHSGTNPVYVLPGTTVTAKDPKATMVPMGTFATVPVSDSVAGTISIALTSTAAATISVFRS